MAHERIEDMVPCEYCKHVGTNQDEEPCYSCIFDFIYGVNEFTGFESANPYWDNICAMADRQRDKGIATYGQGLEDNPADIVKRIEHLQEELIDGLMYCEWIKEELKKMEGNKNDSI